MRGTAASGPVRATELLTELRRARIGPELRAMGFRGSGRDWSLRFATDGVALYDGTAASVEAALRWAPELPEPLAEWLRETVELADLMGERLVPWS